jgi:hypothetical protein
MRPGGPRDGAASWRIWDDQHSPADMVNRLIRQAACAVTRQHNGSGLRLPKDRGPGGMRTTRKGNAMGEEHALMSDLSALIQHLCAKRADLVRTTAANPAHVSGKQIRKLAALQTAFLAVEVEMRRAEREVLHEEVQERTSSIPYQNA